MKNCYDQLIESIESNICNGKKLNHFIGVDPMCLWEEDGDPARLRLMNEMLNNQGIIMQLDNIYLAVIFIEEKWRYFATIIDPSSGYSEFNEVGFFQNYQNVLEYSKAYFLKDLLAAKAVPRTIISN